jgi:Rrf2 family iron-sulfur cluster assembly transcriptional regulator
VRAGLVANRRGRRGGYSVAQEPTDVSLLAIVEAVEGESRRRTCVMRGGPCGGRGAVCDVHHAFAGAQEAANAELAGVTLAEVVALG